MYVCKYGHANFCQVMINFCLSPDPDSKAFSHSIVMDIKGHRRYNNGIKLTKVDI